MGVLQLHQVLGLLCQSGISKLTAGKGEMAQHEVKCRMSNWSGQQVKYLDN